MHSIYTKNSCFHCYLRKKSKPIWKKKNHSSEAVQLLHVLHVHNINTLLFLYPQDFYVLPLTTNHRHSLPSSQLHRSIHQILIRKSSCTSIKKKKRTRALAICFPFFALYWWVKLIRFIFTLSFDFWSFPKSYIDQKWSKRIKYPPDRRLRSHFGKIEWYLSPGTN